MRKRIHRFFAAGLALAMCVAWAAPAAARGGDRRHGYDRDHYREDRGRHRDHYREDRGRHRGHYRGDRHRRHDHHRGAPRYTRGYRGSRHHRDSYRRDDSLYYCAACRHRFDSRGRFHDHLRHTHHIPFFMLPFVIVHGLVDGVFGWVFHG